jgi:hypothetical protein
MQLEHVNSDLEEEEEEEEEEERGNETKSIAMK